MVKTMINQQVMFGAESPIQSHLTPNFRGGKTSPIPIQASPTLPTRDMADTSGPTHFRATVESALQAYEERTGTTLDEDSLTIQVMNYDSVDAMLQNQAAAFAGIRDSDGVLKSMKNIVSVLSRVFACESLGDALSLVCRNELAARSIAFTLFL